MSKKRILCAAFVLLWLLCCPFACAYAQPQTAASDQFLFQQMEYATDPQGEMGPWLYQSDDLTVLITRCRTEDGRRYTLADIRTRNNTTFYSAPANGEWGSGVEMPYLMARRNQAVFGITGDFLTHHGNAKGVMIRAGKVYYDRRDADTLAFFPDGRMAVYPAGSVTADELLARGVSDSYAFGPILLMDGQFYTPGLRHIVASNNRRCSIGMVEPGHYISICSTGGFPVRMLAQLFAEQGCTLAYNMDGGHSASMIFMGEQLNSQPYNLEMQVFQRAIPDMIMLGRSTLVPGQHDAVQYQDVHTGGIIKPTATPQPTGSDAPEPTPQSSETPQPTPQVEQTPNGQE